MKPNAGLEYILCAYVCVCVTDCGSGEHHLAYTYLSQQLAHILLAVQFMYTGKTFQKRWTERIETQGLQEGFELQILLDGSCAGVKLGEVSIDVVVQGGMNRPGIVTVQKLW